MMYKLKTKIKCKKNFKKFIKRSFQEHREMKSLCWVRKAGDKIMQ